MPDRMTGFASEVCVATMAWAREEAEEQVLRASLLALEGTGLPVVLADKGNSAAFSAFLAGRSNFSVTTVSEGPLVAQVQASLSAAERLGTPFVLYTEPDKQHFFSARLRGFLERAPRHAGVGVVLAARSSASFATFPPFQQYTEGVINHLTGQSSGQPGDYSYGPMLLARAVLPHVQALGVDVGWGWRHFAVCTALQLGLTVHLVEGDHPCPADQRIEDADERTHRLRQLAQNITGLVRAAAAPDVVTGVRAAAAKEEP